VEYRAAGHQQSQVIRRRHHIRHGLRALLRQDPNVIMVGEIRDTEKASIAVQASLTGHMCFPPCTASDCGGRGDAIG